ncbi:DUF2911 domain-containing protein [Flexithrix dorotheae]|uniref:DUF2911 domain-containing protein n=1 Tax=Flexithrix dorotheae TaxID=70993 RepID=UPI0003A38536|nr:DUF2911 domain-containing protein [Flexithrix dorotheae]
MKTHKFLPIFIAIFTLGLCSAELFAQIQMPQPSPAASVTQKVGLTNITVEYSSPGVKGRKVFGELQKFGTTWRAGANQPTKITFSTAVKVGGKELNAGSYAISIKPMESGDWTIYLHGDGKSIFTYFNQGNVDEAKLESEAAVKLSATPKQLSDAVERLVYVISAGDNKTGKVSMAWDKTMVSFDVDTNPEGIIESMKNSLK